MDNDILELIDQIEALVESAPKVPMMSKVMVDGETIVEICEQLRSAIPREVTRARRVLEEYEYRLAEAKLSGTQSAPASSSAESSEARRGPESQEVRSASIAGEGAGEEDPVIEAARRRAAEIVAEGEREAEARRADADAYMVEVLQRLEAQLAGMMKSVRKGLETLEAANHQT